MTRLADRTFFGLRACFTPRIKHALSSIGGGRDLKLAVQRVDPQGVSQAGEGVGFWV